MMNCVILMSVMVSLLMSSVLSFLPGIRLLSVDTKYKDLSNQRRSLNKCNCDSSDACHLEHWEVNFRRDKSIFSTLFNSTRIEDIIYPKGMNIGRC